MKLLMVLLVLLSFNSIAQQGVTDSSVPLKPRANNILFAGESFKIIKVASCTLSDCLKACDDELESCKQSGKNVDFCNLNAHKCQRGCASECD